MCNASLSRSSEFCGFPQTPDAPAAGPRRDLVRIFPAGSSDRASEKWTCRGRRLGGGQGLAGADAALPGGEMLVTANDGLGLLDDLLALGEDELDVAGVGHVGVDLGGSGQHERPAGMLGFANVHDRGHGKSSCAAWGPGSLGCA